MSIGLAGGDGSRPSISTGDARSAMLEPASTLGVATTADEDVLDNAVDSGDSLESRVEQDPTATSRTPAAIQVTRRFNQRATGLL